MFAATAPGLLMITLLFRCTLIMGIDGCQSHCLLLLGFASDFNVFKLNKHISNSETAMLSRWDSQKEEKATRF